MEGQILVSLRERLARMGYSSPFIEDAIRTRWVYPGATPEELEECADLVDCDWYRGIVGDVIDPVVHYLTKGWRDGLWPNPFFDPNYYISQQGLNKAETGCPLLHYVRHGARLGLPTSHGVDWHAYASAYQDVEASGLSPMRHYMLLGRVMGRKPHGISAR